MFEDIFKFGLMVSFIDEISRPLKNAERNLNKFEQKVASLHDKFAKMSKIGMKMASVGFGITASLASQTEAAVEFSKNMAEVSTLVDTSAVNMGKLKAKLLELAPTLGMDTSTATRALYNIISAGVKASDSLKVLKLAGEAAVAGVTDVNTAATIGTQIMNAYGMSVKQLPHIYDLLFMTVKNGVTTFPELAQYLGEVLPSAKAAHVSLEQLSAAIAGMTKVGIRTPEAATALKGLLIALAAPASQAGKALERMGGEEFKTAVASGNLVKALTILAPRVRSLADARAIIPDERAAKAFLALTSHLKEFQETTKQMIHSGGAMQEAFKKMEATSAFSIGKLKSEMHSVAITIGMALLPSLKALADALYKTFVPLQRFILSHQKLAKAILVPLGGFGILIMTIGSFLTVLGFAGSLVTRMIMGYKNLGVAISFLKTRYISIIAPAKAFIASQWASLRAMAAEEGGILALSKAFALRLVAGIKNVVIAMRTFGVSMLTNPIGIAIAGIALAAVLIYKFWKPLKAFFKGVARGIAEALKPLRPVFNVLLEPIKFIAKGIGYLIHIISSLFRPVNASKKSLQRLSSVGETVGKLLPYAFMPVLIPLKLIKVAIEILKKVLSNFGLSVKGVFGVLKSIFMNFTPLGWMIKGFLALKSFFSHFNLADSGKKIIHTLVSGIKSVALAPYHAIKSIFTKIRKLLPFSDAKEGPLSQLTKSGKSIVNTLAKGVLIQKDTLRMALVKTMKVPNISALTTPVKFAMEKLRMPSLKPLIAPVRFAYDKLVKPSLGALTAPVKFIYDKFKIPNISALTTPVKFAMEKMVQPNLPRSSVFATHGSINVNLTQHFNVDGSLDNRAVETIGKTTEDAIKRVIEKYFYEKERVSF